MSKASVLVSNYPGVKEGLRAVVKVGCHLPGSKLRLLAIARKAVVTEGNPFVGGFLSKAVLPAEKDEKGRYSLTSGTMVRAFRHLQQEGVLWLSPTGNPEGNGLMIKDLRFGAVALALKANVPVVPMGLITNQEKKVKIIEFGEAIVLPSLERVSIFDQDENLRLLSLLILAKIAALLPSGQRGDFEDFKTAIEEIESKFFN